MEKNGQARYDGGKGDVHYKYWTVTTNDVYQWIGIWMYMLAQPGDRASYFQPPEGGFGPKHDLKAWIHIGHPEAQRGVFWFNMMQACFELPTYGRKSDPFNRTRYFWDALRDGFFAAVTWQGVAGGGRRRGWQGVARRSTATAQDVASSCDVVRLTASIGGVYTGVNRS